MTTQTLTANSGQNTTTEIFEGANAYIQIGHNKRVLFESLVEEFYDDLDAHAYFVGEPGSGKSHAVTRFADTKDVVFTHFSGKTTPWAFSKQMAVTCHAAGWPMNDMNWSQKQLDQLPNIAVFCEDIPNMLKDDFVDLMRIVLDTKGGDYVPYNISLGGQYAQSEEFEKDAMDYFKTPGQVGFKVPFYGKVKFIFTMNSRLANENEVSAFKKHTKAPNKAAVAKLETEAAVRSRFGNYHDLSMTKDEYWGWIADLLINEKILPGANISDINEILEYLYDKWDRIPDRSIRYVLEVLWRLKAKSKNNPSFNYRARWESTLV